MNCYRKFIGKISYSGEPLISLLKESYRQFCRVQWKFIIMTDPRCCEKIGRSGGKRSRRNSYKTLRFEDWLRHLYQDGRRTEDLHDLRILQCIDDIKNVKTNQIIKAQGGGDDLAITSTCHRYKHLRTATILLMEDDGGRENITDRRRYN